MDVKTGDYFYDAVQWAVGKGIIDGRPDEGIAPQGTATRAETAKMLMACLEGDGFIPSEHEKHWVDGRVWTGYPEFVCTGCNATAAFDKASFVHEPSCPIHTGGLVWIGESWTEDDWIDLSTAEGDLRDWALMKIENRGLLVGWYEWE